MKFSKRWYVVVFILCAVILILMSIAGEKEMKWKVTYKGTDLPESPWEKVCPSGSSNCITEIRDGCLFISDMGKEKGDYIYFTYPWNIRPEDETIIEIKFKLISGFNAIIFSNGISTEEIRFYHDKVVGVYGKTSVSAITTDRFHIYRIEIKNNDYKLYIDDNLKIDGSGKYNPVAEYGNRNSLEFGAATSGTTGEGLWEYVRWATSGDGSGATTSVSPSLQPKIKITSFKVDYPDPYSFRIIVKATSENIKIGAYGIRSVNKMDEGEVPPGFVLGWGGYAIPEKMEFSDRGDTDNGPFDEDENKEDGVYVRTFSTKGWKPGKYSFTVHVHNRPAPGPYIFDHRDFDIVISSEGKIKPEEPVKTVKNKKDVVIYKEKDAYCAFPRFYKEEGRDVLICEFGIKYIASHLHPIPKRMTLISEDGGLTWKETTQKFIFPAWKNKKGELIYVRAGGWVYVTDKTKEELEKEGKIALSDRGVTAFLSTESKKVISIDNGQTWQTELLNTPEYISGLMGFFDENSYIITSKGIRLIGIYGYRKGSKKEEVFFWRSEDDGKTWQFVPLLPSPDKDIPPLSEPALIETRDGKILVVMRCELEDIAQRYLYQSFSCDGGLTWSKPEKTPVWGYPAHLLMLSDGKILCTYGYRRNPMGIRACVSADNGKTWQIEKEYVLRTDGIQGPDLGYPISALLSDGSIYTCYYFTTAEDGITHIAGTRWKLD